MYYYSLSMSNKSNSREDVPSEDPSDLGTELAFRAGHIRLATLLCQGASYVLWPEKSKPANLVTLPDDA